jgi:hypothetical protein
MQQRARFSSASAAAVVNHEIHAAEWPTSWIFCWICALQLLFFGLVDLLAWALCVSWKTFSHEISKGSEPSI